MLDVYIDADGCAVKDEVYKVAGRYQLSVFVVANKPLQTPMDPKIEMKVVSGDFDAADDWIVEKIDVGDILVTSDLLLADRCIKIGARVIGPKGRELSEDNIGDVLGARELNSHLRDLGHSGTGPKPMTKENRSRFLSELDRVINSVKKRKR